VQAEFGVMLALLPIVLTALAFFVVGVLFALLRSVFSPVQAVWLFPVAFVAAEALVSPQVVWGTVSVIGASISTVAAQSPFLLAAPWSGQGGVASLVVLTNGALYMVLRHRLTSGILVLIGVAALLALPNLLFPTSQGATARVAVVQGNISNDHYRRALSDEETRADLVAHYGLLHRQAKALSPDLVVYPETHLPGVREPGEWGEALEIARGGPPTVLGTLVGEPLAARRLRGEVKNVRTYQFGTFRVQPYRRLTNATLLWDGKGMNLAYEKRALFPFGETYDPGRFMPPAPLGDLRLGFLICYDNTIPAQVLGRVRQGSTLLVVTANTSFAAGSPMPLGHLMISQLMAASTRRSLAHVSQSGPSALIGPDGRFLRSIPAGQVEVALGAAPVLTGLTPFVRYGDWVAHICLIGFFGLALLGLLTASIAMSSVTRSQLTSEEPEGVGG
jgi:apolipoprotein N-acyltransferase